MRKRSFTFKSAEETQQFGESLGKELKSGGVLFLFGDLGSGKTTFTQGFAKGLGITHRVNSPTFLLVRTYELPHNKKGKFYHVDLYRINAEKEIVDLGLTDFMQDPSNVIAIEWAEKMKSLLPDKRRELHFTYIDEDTREVEEIIYD